MCFAACPGPLPFLCRTVTITCTCLGQSAPYQAAVCELKKSLQHITHTQLLKECVEVCRECQPHWYIVNCRSRPASKASSSPSSKRQHLVLMLLLHPLPHQLPKQLLISHQLPSQLQPPAQLPAQQLMAHLLPMGRLLSRRKARRRTEEAAEEIKRQMTDLLTSLGKLALWACS